MLKQEPPMFVIEGRGQPGGFSISLRFGEHEWHKNVGLNDFDREFVLALRWVRKLVRDRST